MRRALLLSTLAGTLAAIGLTACSDTTRPNDARLAAGGNAAARGRPGTTGAVYVQDNSAGENHVVIYRRSADGQLQHGQAVRTGGRGTGHPRLGSQGSVILSADNHWLLVCNVGSDQISVFAVNDHGLTLSDLAPSGGRMPLSLTLHGDLLYVLNGGGALPGGSDNITAFRLSNSGTLTAVAGSTRPLSGADTKPAEVAFSPDGAALVVTEKATSMIDTYTVGADGLASAPSAHASNGETPFGFAFRETGEFVVTEAHNTAAGVASASSYRLTGGSGLAVISASVPNTQSDVCWAVISADQHYAYVTNNGSGTLSSYRIASDGSLTLLHAVAGVTGTTGGFGPRDQDLSDDGQYLYVIDVGTQRVNAFHVAGDGSLTHIDEDGGLPKSLAGLAAR